MSSNPTTFSQTDQGGCIMALAKLVTRHPLHHQNKHTPWLQGCNDAQAQLVLMLLVLLASDAPRRAAAAAAAAAAAGPPDLHRGLQAMQDLILVHQVSDQLNHSSSGVSTTVPNRRTFLLLLLVHALF
jgi:hypothetical protein